MIIFIFILRQLITHEQQQILNHDIQNNHVVKIMAFAGEEKSFKLLHSRKCLSSM